MYRHILKLILILPFLVAVVFAQPTISMPDTTATTGGTVTFDVNIQGLAAGDSVLSIQLKYTFDPALTNPDTSLSGLPSQNWSFKTFDTTTSPVVLDLGAFTSPPFSDIAMGADGTIARLTFTAPAAAGTYCLTITSILLETVNFAPYYQDTSGFSQPCVNVSPATVSCTLNVITVPPGIPTYINGTSRTSIDTICGATAQISCDSSSGSYIFDRWSDGGARTHNVSVGTRTDTAYYIDTTTVNCTLQLSTSPATIPLSVFSINGVSRSSIDTTCGATVTIMCDPVYGSYNFNNWSDGGAISHNVNVSNGTITAYYTSGSIGPHIPGFCVNWLPVYICPNSCFELDVCHDTLNPGYIYDRVYVYSHLEELATGASGSWYDLTFEPADIPLICNSAFWTDSGWVFGWDSVFVYAETSGVAAADTSFWVFHYPPDSAYIGSSGLTICPESSGTLFAKWLEVRGAFFWSFVEGTLAIDNNFAHREIIDTTICIVPDHQAYSAPDSLDPGVIDTLYDPCPTAICSTFTLLPTDVVDDEVFEVCKDVCETLVVQTYYPYEHCLITDVSETLFCRSDTTVHDSLGWSADTFVFCPTDCGTTTVYYVTTDSTCLVGAIDSFSIIVPCVNYEIFVNGTMAHDSGEAFCPGETLSLCLGGELCDGFDSSNVCWTLPGDYQCNICATYIADTSFRAYLNFSDCYGCTHYDSVDISVNPKAYFTFSDSGSCLGSPVWFTVSSDSGAAISSVLFEFGDDVYEIVDTVDASGNFVSTHTYSDVGNYLAFATITTDSGCSAKDSLWVRQSNITASLSGDPLPVCIGSPIMLDASASIVEPPGELFHKFFDPNGDSIYWGELSYAIDTAESAGIYTVWVIDSVAACSSYAVLNVPVKWVDVSAPESVWAVEGCSRCIALGAIPYYCDDEMRFGYSSSDSSGTLWTEIVPLYDAELCTAPIMDTTNYRVFAWCNDCPEGKDSADVVVMPVYIDGLAVDTVLCFGDLMPNLLIADSLDIQPPSLADSIVCQVIYVFGASEMDTLFDWAPVSTIPSLFSGYPAVNDGMLIYRFALWGATECAYEISARVTIRHPVALLSISPNDTICRDIPITLDASESYSNCDGINLCYNYFNVIDGDFWPLDGGAPCCSTGCDTFVPSWVADPGEYQFAVVVCMEDVPWCCDTGYADLLVCEIDPPVVFAEPECAPGTLAVGEEVTLSVLNASDYDHFCWGTDGSLPPPCLGTDSIFTYTPTSAGTLVIELCVYSCDTACSYCLADTFWVDEPPTVVSPWNVSATEDNCPFALDLSSHIIDSDSDGWWTELLSGPEDLTVDSSGMLNWDCPTNCDVGDNDVLVAVHDNSVCAGTETLEVIITVNNTFAGITGIDSSFGFSCVSPTFDPVAGTLVLDGIYCYDISFELTGDDEGDCDCGFWTAESLFWLVVNEVSGVVTADVSAIPQGDYTDYIYYSDCNSVDTIAVSITVPNHAPLVLTVPHEIWLPSGDDTVAVRLSDFSDVDGDPLDWVNFDITNLENYDLSALGEDLDLGASVNYENFPGYPDTLAVSVTDGLAEANAEILVWVYDADIMQPENRKPNRTALVGAYPNPFNNVVWLEAELTEPQNIQLDIFDNTGRLIKNIFSGYLPASVIKFAWNGSDWNNNPVPSGAYIAVMKAGDKKFSQNIRLIK